MWFLKILKTKFNKTFAFFPDTPETLSRIVVEARMMGMSIKTSKLVGAGYEKWFALKGEELIDFMIEKRSEITNLFLNEINSAKPRHSERPKVSIITTFYKAEEYLEGFLQNITTQSVFDQCELVMVDTASPGNEQKMVQDYVSKYPQIKNLRNSPETHLFL